MATRVWRVTLVLASVWLLAACGRVYAEIESLESVDLSHQEVVTFVVTLPRGVSWVDEADPASRLTVNGSAGRLVPTVVGDDPYAVTVGELVPGSVALVIPEGSLKDGLGNRSPEIVSDPVTIVDSAPTPPVLAPLPDLTAAHATLEATWHLGPDVDLVDVAWALGPSATEAPARFSSIRADARSVSITKADAPDCQWYHLWVRVTDASGQQTQVASAEPFYADTVPPQTSFQFEDVATFDQGPRVSWGEVVENCPGVVEYTTAIGTAAGSSDVLDVSVPLEDVAIHQPRDGVDEVSLTLFGGRTYHSTVGLRDLAGNVVPSAFTWSVNNHSCRALKEADPSLSDGTYPIDWDRDGIEAESMPLYCDMTTQGGGWTLAVRYDRRQATPDAFALPQGTGRHAQYADDLAVRVEDTQRLAASIDLRPFVANGATHLMHATLDDADETYLYVYFSEIYESVRANPDWLFDADQFDTNAGEGVAGISEPWSEDVANRWFEGDFSVMRRQTIGGNLIRDAMIVGGEGDGMFTNGDRDGAVYTCGTARVGNVAGFDDPKVHWGFYGQDDSQGDYQGSVHVGTHCGAGLSDACESAGAYSLMFVR